MDITGDDLVCIIATVCGAAIIITAILKGYEL